MVLPVFCQFRMKENNPSEERRFGKLRTSSGTLAVPRRSFGGGGRDNDFQKSEPELSSTSQCGIVGDQRAHFCYNVENDFGSPGPIPALEIELK
jgi:hypothetical protein